MSGERKRIRAVLFDKDGTLIDFRRTWLAAYRGAAADLARAAGLGAGFADALLARHGYDPAADRFRADSPLLWAATEDVVTLWAAEPELARVPDVSARLRRHFADHDAYPPVPVAELPPLFAALCRRGLRLGLATMDTTAAAEDTLARLTLRRHVSFVAGADGAHGVKPGPGMVLAFCAALGLAPGAVAVVGDTLADLAMARAAGAGLAIAVRTGESPEHELAAMADLVLASVAELEAALLPWLAVEDR